MLHHLKLALRSFRRRPGYALTNIAGMAVGITTFGPMLVEREGASFQEDRFFYGDSTYFHVFSHQFLAGDPATALIRPNTLVLTESMAKKDFPDDDAMGKVLLVGGGQSFEVTGVIADIPANSHLRFDFLASLVTRSSWSVLTDTEWSSANFLTYLMLTDAAAVATLEQRATAMIDREFGELLRNA